MEKSKDSVDTTNPMEPAEILQITTKEEDASTGVLSTRVNVLFYFYLKLFNIFELSASPD